MEVAALGPLRVLCVLCGKFSRLPSGNADSIECEDAHCSAEAERKAAEDIGEPMLADVHAIRSGYEWPTNPECAGLAVC